MLRDIKVITTIGTQWLGTYL